MREACLWCKWFVAGYKRDDSDYCGECRRRSPSVQPNGNCAWPYMHTSGAWCGEFEDRGSEPMRHQNSDLDRKVTP
jgi:hypothetical protein